MTHPNVAHVVRWRKSSRSGGEGTECVELASTMDALRDSKNPDHSLTTAATRDFVRAVRDGHFDR